MIEATRIGDKQGLIRQLHRALANTGSPWEAASVLGCDQATFWRLRKAYGIWSLNRQGSLIWNLLEKSVDKILINI